MASHRSSWRTLALALLALLLTLLVPVAAPAAQTQPSPAMSSLKCVPETAQVGQSVACVILADDTTRHFEFRWSGEDDVSAGPIEIGALARSFTFRTPGLKYVAGIVCNEWVEGRVNPIRDPRCSFMVTAVTIVAAECSWTGTWSSNWGEMRFTQTDGTVNGDYDWDQGLITGTVTGNVLSATWTEAPSRQPPSDAGDVEFTMAEGCASFTGKWRYGSDGELGSSWDAERKP